ncbi:MAG TPA: hypothetical protein QGH56_06510, partial [Candidatus Marinimicrobia bacterium]|nr:hypothetical protein [Candidatus Neomarinimicrobiota bacterium]
MKLLKTMLVLTVTAMFVVSSAFAGVGDQKSASPVNSQTDIQSIFSAKKAANYSVQDASVSSEVHPTYEPGLRTTDVTISCDGGSWQSEVSWQIYDGAGNMVAEGGAPFAGDASLDDGVYSVDGQDAYGDGWNSNMLIGTDANTGTQYLNWTVDGTGGSTTFEIS